MKKIIVLIGMLSGITVISCNNHRDDTSSSHPPEQYNTTVAPQPAPAKVEETGTTIKINEEGVSYSNKDGNNESKVKVSQDSTSIEIKRPR